jgi:hypothetical protein
MVHFCSKKNERKTLKEKASCSTKYNLLIFCGPLVKKESWVVILVKESTQYSLVSYSCIKTCTMYNDQQMHN